MHTRSTMMWTLVLLLGGGTVAGGGAALYFSHRANRAAEVAVDQTREIERLNALLAAREKAIDKLRQEGVPPAPVPAAVSGDEASARVADLEAELIELRNQLAETEERQVADAPRNRGPENGDGQDRSRNAQDFFARMKEADPEQYARMQEAIKSRQKQMIDSMAQQSAYLIKLDTSKMSPEQVKNHERLLALMAENWTLTKSLEEDPASLDMGEIRRVMRTNMREMGGLMQNERDVALEQLGQAVGYTGEQAQSFKDIVQNIYDMTSPRSLFMPGGGRGSRGRDGTNR